MTSEQHKGAKTRAAELGMSLAEYIRLVVTRDLGETRATADVSTLFNLGDSGGSDIARRKDEYAGEAAEVELEHDLGARVDR